MRFRPCWILLSVSAAMAVVAMRWSVVGNDRTALLAGSISALYLVYFLLVEGKEPAKGYKLWN